MEGEPENLKNNESEKNAEEPMTLSEFGEAVQDVQSIEDLIALLRTANMPIPISGRREKSSADMAASLERELNDLSKTAKPDAYGPLSEDNVRMHFKRTTAREITQNFGLRSKAEELFVRKFAEK